MLRRADGCGSVIRSPRALCYMSHIGWGGGHPPNRVVWGKAVCAALLAPAWEGQGQMRHLSLAKRLFPRGLGQIRLTNLLIFIEI